ncbi:MAG: HAD family hydrolase [Clostridia bacterium]|nr:HAD family hydrolase [Clostridia bacterium]
MKNILFDLDGTLTDPKVGITKSVAYALAHYGIEVKELDTLCPFIGPPLIHSFMKYYGFTEEKASEAVDVYREYFSVTGLFENEVYDGIEDMLKALKASGKRLFVATSKPEKFAKQILEHFSLAQYFECIRGIEMHEEKVEKPEIVRRVLEGYGLDKAESVMVGDRFYDIVGAKENGIASIGVTYGYGDYEELFKYGADKIAYNVNGLKEMLML